MRSHHAALLPLLLAACAVPLHELRERAPAAPAVHARTAPATPAPGDAAASMSTARPQEQGRRYGYFDIMFGASYWDDLGDLDPSGVSPIPGRFGDFDSWGTAFDFGYDHVVWYEGSDAVTVGLETGWTAFENDGSGLSASADSIGASVWYIAPALRWRHELSGSVTISPGIGAGYYGVSFDEYDSYYYGWWWGYETRTLYDDSAFGGFVSLGFDFNTSPNSAIRIDNKLHFADFDGLDRLMPNETDVSGPIWTIGIGFVICL